MRKTLVALALVGAALWCLPMTPAHAQATRTWVSGVGDDANPCSRTAPCKTFAGAISKTANGGEIDALDPGGFGALTITKSITIDGGGGQVASVLVTGTNGIVITATATDVIILKNLRFQGVLGNGGNPGNAGQTAIKILSPGAAMVVIENVEIYGFAINGIQDTRAAGGKLNVKNTTIYNVAGTGILVNGGAGAARLDAAIVESDISFAGTGITAANGPHVTVKRTTVSNSKFNALDVENAGTVMNFDDGIVSNSATGIFTTASGQLFMSNSDIVNNTTGANGAWNSYLNNRISGNGSPGTGPTAASPGQQ